ncbi:MAG: hypothetical protein AAF721_14970 [Myxococcota bacterium]
MGKVGFVVGVSLALVACSAGADPNAGLTIGVGASDDPMEATGDASASDEGDDESQGGDAGSDTGTTPADIDEQDTGNDAADEGTDSTGSTDDGSESSSDGAAPVGDPQCPPGFLVAFDVTDDDGDQMGQHQGWLPGILFDQSSRVSFEIWGTGVDHYGPIVWDTSGFAAAFDEFAAGSGTVTGLISEDGGWRMTLVPNETFVFVTGADDDPQIGGTHLFGWLAPRYTSNDEIFGINAPYPGAYVDRYESGDRWVACYDPAA